MQIMDKYERLARDGFFNLCGFISAFEEFAEDDTMTDRQKLEAIIEKAHKLNDEVEAERLKLMQQLNY